MVLWSAHFITFTVLALYCSTIASCQGNPGFIPVETGGDGVVSQFCEPNISNVNDIILTFVSGYVGFDPGLQTVIVAHQGTDVGDM